MFLQDERRPPSEIQTTRQFCMPQTALSQLKENSTIKNPGPKGQVRISSNIETRSCVSMKAHKSPCPGSSESDDKKSQTENSFLYQRYKRLRQNDVDAEKGSQTAIKQDVDGDKISCQSYQAQYRSCVQTAESATSAKWPCPTLTRSSSKTEVSASRSDSPSMDKCRRSRSQTNISNVHPTTSDIMYSCSPNLYSRLRSENAAAMNNFTSGISVPFSSPRTPPPSTTTTFNKGCSCGRSQLQRFGADQITTVSTSAASRSMSMLAKITCLCNSKVTEPSHAVIDEGHDLRSQELKSKDDDPEIESTCRICKPKESSMKHSLKEPSCIGWKDYEPDPSENEPQNELSCSICKQKESTTKSSPNEDSCIEWKDYEPEPRVLKEKDPSCSICKKKESIMKPSLGKLPCFYARSDLLNELSPSGEILCLCGRRLSTLPTTPSLGKTPCIFARSDLMNVVSPSQGEVLCLCGRSHLLRDDETNISPSRIPCMVARSDLINARTASHREVFCLCGRSHVIIQEPTASPSQDEPDQDASKECSSRLGASGNKMSPDCSLKNIASRRSNPCGMKTSSKCMTEDMFFDCESSESDTSIPGTKAPCSKSSRASSTPKRTKKIVPTTDTNESDEPFCCSPACPCAMPDNSTDSSKFQFLCSPTSPCAAPASPTESSNQTYICSPTLTDKDMDNFGLTSIQETICQCKRAMNSVVGVNQSIGNVCECDAAGGPRGNTNYSATCNDELESTFNDCDETSSSCSCTCSCSCGGFESLESSEKYDQKERKDRVFYLLNQLTVDSNCEMPQGARDRIKELFAELTMLLRQEDEDAKPPGKEVPRPQVPFEECCSKVIAQPDKDTGKELQEKKRQKCFDRLNDYLRICFGIKPDPKPKGLPEIYNLEIDPTFYLFKSSSCEDSNKYEPDIMEEGAQEGTQPDMFYGNCGLESVIVPCGETGVEDDTEAVYGAEAVGAGEIECAAEAPEAEEGEDEGECAFEGTSVIFRGECRSSTVEQESTLYFGECDSRIEQTIAVESTVPVETTARVESTGPAESSGPVETPCPAEAEESCTCVICQNAMEDLFEIESYSCHPPPPCPPPPCPPPCEPPCPPPPCPPPPCPCLPSCTPMPPCGADQPSGKELICSSGIDSMQPQSCICCHCRAILCENECQAVTKTLQSALCNPANEMKYFIDSIIIDLEAMDHVLREKEIKPKVPQAIKIVGRAPREGFPVNITQVSSIGCGALFVRWDVQDCRGIAGYEIYVDGHLTSRLYSFRHEAGIAANVDVTKTHQIVLRAHPVGVEYAGDSCNCTTVVSPNPELAAGAEKPWSPSVYFYDPM